MAEKVLFPMNRYIVQTLYEVLQTVNHLNIQNTKRALMCILHVSCNVYTLIEAGKLFTVESNFKWKTSRIFGKIEHLRMEGIEKTLSLIEGLFPYASRRHSILFAIFLLAEQIDLKHNDQLFLLSLSRTQKLPNTCTTKSSVACHNTSSCSSRSSLRKTQF